MPTSLTPEHHQNAWRAATRLLGRRQEELRQAAAQWEQGLVSIQVLSDLNDEVRALRDFEHTLFQKAFPPVVANTSEGASRGCEPIVDESRPPRARRSD